LYDQNEVNIKYISMNIDPKGSKPAENMITKGFKYHGETGIGLIK
jgi:hypothetical protein